MERVEDTDRSIASDVEAAPGASASVRALRVAARLATGLAVCVLIAYVGWRGRELWDEWQSLQGEERTVRITAVVGYKNINFEPSFARFPPDWVHDQGDQTLLWAGWKDNAHRWFRVERGEVPKDLLSMPIGRDTTRPIDVPIFETDGEPIWGKVPDEADVAGVVFGGETRVYPILVMDKVEAVNDTVDGRPVLVAYCRATDRPASVTVYDASLGGDRVAMGTSGYSIGGQPMLYDRGTESLWVSRGGDLTAISGARKGATLPRIARAEIVAWSDWKSRFPGSRLLVGADRRKPAATE